jgi:hypothetical protein
MNENFVARQGRVSLNEAKAAVVIKARRAHIDRVIFQARIDLARGQGWLKL